uniref:Hypothetical regulatory protein n=1 Tax=Kitasatospora aureofaciens TaxID=1894 RepID=Q8GFE9_KITAU|nr:hypothetical regulatory protein [Kitasatospora aureofaciens]
MRARRRAERTPPAARRGTRRRRRRGGFRDDGAGVCPMRLSARRRRPESDGVERLSAWLSSRPGCGRAPCRDRSDDARCRAEPRRRSSSGTTPGPAPGLRAGLLPLGSSGRCIRRLDRDYEMARRGRLRCRWAGAAPRQGGRGRIPIRPSPPLRCGRWRARHRDRPCHTAGPRVQAVRTRSTQRGAGAARS